MTEEEIERQALPPGLTYADFCAAMMRRYGFVNWQCEEAFETGQRSAMGGEPVYLAQLRNGATTWIRFTEGQWNRLGAEWDKLIGYKP